MKKTCEIAVTVNGTVYEAAVEPRLLLADFLRDTLGLTGTHVGCEHGVCGACTVLVDGDSARSCLMLAVQANGRRDSLSLLINLLEIGILQILGDLALTELVLAPRLGDGGNVGVLRQFVTEPLGDEDLPGRADLFPPLNVRQARASR